MLLKCPCGKVPGQLQGFVESTLQHQHPGDFEIDHRQCRTQLARMLQLRFCFLQFANRRQQLPQVGVTLGADGAFGPGTRIAALSSLDFEDLMPNVRVREDGALEMVFSSNRTTWGHGKPAFGLQDVYVSYSWWPSKGWSEPQNLGPSVNTAGVEQRATLSHDGKRLYFGRDGDIFTSSRQRRHSRA